MESDTVRRDMYGGFWIRTFASLIDTALFSAVVYPFLIAAYGWKYLESDAFEGPLDVLLSGVLPAVAIMAFWILKSATPGKMAFGLRIIDARTGGRRSNVQFVKRLLGYFVSVAVLGLGFIWVGLDPRKRGWHDNLAGTVVVWAQGATTVGPHSASMRRACRFAMLWTVGISFVVSCGLAIWIVERLASQRGVRPDFLTNGLNYIPATVGMIAGVVFPPYLALVLYFVIPKLRVSSNWGRTWLLTSPSLVVGVLLPGLAFLLLFLVSGNTLERTAGVVSIGPPLVGTALACCWYLRRLDTELSFSSSGVRY